MDIKHCTYDYLPGTQIYYYQDPKMFHVNTDTALLGQFMKIRKKDVVMDIGTNNGALLLYAMQYHPKALIGVEVNQEASTLARYNLDHHQQYEARIITADILTLAHPPVSCIVCNPPYFKVDDPNKVNASQHLARARHETNLTLDVLLPKISSLLEDRGRLYMVHRGDRLIDLAVLCRQHRMEIKKIQLVFDEAKEDARSVLIEAMKNGKPHCRILSPILLKRESLPLIKSND